MKLKKNRELNQAILDKLEDLEFIVKMNPSQVSNYNNLDKDYLKQQVAVLSYLINQIK